MREAPPPWQVTKLLGYLAELFDNQSLDPSYWMSSIGGAYSHMCREAPAQFVGAELFLFVLFALAILFEADFTRWRRERELAAQGYKQLEVGDDGPTDEVRDEETRIRTHRHAASAGPWSLSPLTSLLPLDHGWAGAREALPRAG
jgi:hypothetical protein